MQTPAQRYQPSLITYREHLLPIEYPATDIVMTVGWNGFIKFMGRRLRLSTAASAARRITPGSGGGWSL